MRVILWLQVTWGGVCVCLGGGPSGILSSYYTYTYMHMYVCMYVCVYIWLEGVIIIMIVFDLFFFFFVTVLARRLRGGLEGAAGDEDGGLSE